MKNVFSRFKMATGLNIAGLSVAFTVFTIIAMQLEYEYSYDRMYPHSNTIYRVERVDDTRPFVIHPRPFAEAFIKSSPHIVVGALNYPWNEETSIVIEIDGNRNSYKEYVKRIFPEYLDVMDFTMVEGSGKIPEDGKVLIPLSMSRKFFGNESATGKLLSINDFTYIVGGVYNDFPENSVIGNFVYLRLNEYADLNSWENFNYELWIRLDSPENSANLIENFTKNFKAPEVFGNSYALRLTPLPEIHFDNEVNFDHTPKSPTKQSLFILFSIGCILLVIAGINFTNFSADH
jgi:putative ABC transport system permease protein